MVGVILLGWVFGIVINFLADQLPNNDWTLSAPVCVKCGQGIRHTNYLFLSNCTQCGRRQSKRAWIVQLAYPIIILFIWVFPHNRLPFAVEALLLVYMGLIIVIDIEHRLVLGPLSMAGVVIGGMAGIFLHGWLLTLLGCLAGFLIMYGIYWLGRFFSAWMSKRNKQEVEKEALGFGDVYIAGIIGLVLGWPGVTAGLVLGIILGGVFSGLFLLGMAIFKRYRYFTTIPYAPFLIIATILLIFWPK